MISEIIAYESGELTHFQTIALFSQLITTGMIDRLQGHYGRQAADMIASGVLSPEGAINREVCESMGIETHYRMAR